MPVRLEIVSETADDLLTHFGELARRLLSTMSHSATVIDIGSGSVVQPEPEAVSEPTKKPPRKNAKKAEPEQTDIEDQLPPVIKVADLKPAELAKIPADEFDAFDAETRAQVERDFADSDLAIISDDNARRCRDAIQKLYDDHSDEPSRESLKVFRAVKVSQLRDVHADLFCRYVLGLRDHLNAQKKQK